uniref:FMRFamide-related peptides type HF-4 n=1 Tax=Cornu aspersum TaxID=6535 RepID=FAR1_CORAP|nr:RecName: Full=FMRFamide-related peptides type HF-4; AltName: Full=HeptaFaRP; Contains: RecName: Full=NDPFLRFGKKSDPFLRF-amide; Contains: RecName: Full=FMRFamide-like; Contains: RecName: Full=ENNNGYIRF-amide; Contains: RecName: Full=NDPFLRF-amide; Contains: RecName: Full=QDPFLRI-amide; Contains: RecName: Full=QDPFLRF-amide; Contains: RecName: Full=KQDPFLRI-amide; Contains: RecName: Full=SEPYLRF-amide; Contains: RecName: Full=NDPYLRF-amide; Flags: Precursor [Cornu aspersum]CAA51760.1 HeptaFaRP [Co
MTSLCLTIAPAVLSLICLSSYGWAEGDTTDNEYLRFGRENNNGYIRFGRNDPFLRFGKKSDPFLRFGKQDPFLRIGRQDPFLRFGKQDPFLRFGKQDPFLRIGKQDPFLRFGRSEPYLRFGRNDPYLRFGRNDPYLRFGRNDPYLRFGRNDPYLRFGKNDPFLRFGKSVDGEIEAGVDAVTLSREHEFAHENAASDRQKRSAYTDAIDKDNSLTSLVREAREASDSNGQINDGKVVEVPVFRDTRNGHYMRFGKKNEVDVTDGDTYDRDYSDSDVSNLLRYYGNTVPLPAYDKRSEHKQEYMRFG